MNKDTLKHRTARLADINNANTFLNINVEINIEAALPMFVVHDDLINRTKYLETSSRTIKKPNITIGDKEYTEKYNQSRFVFLGSAESGQTHDIIFLYYDRLFKDIIVLPDLSYLTVDVMPTTYLVNGYALGYVNTKQLVLQPSDTIPVDESLKFELPEPVTNTEMVLTSCWLNNSTKSLKYSSLEIAKVLDDGTQLNTTFVDYYHIVTLDTPNIFFKEDVPIPHYIMYQMGPGKYMLKSQGNKTTKSKLRFSILF